LNKCGDFFFSGIGMNEPDHDKALEYYKKSAELNNENALLNLGAYYE